MSERTARAAELLRTRVDVERSAQNQKIMHRMDRRAGRQLRAAAHGVEGPSVVAISYYAVGLLSYALAPLAGRAGLDKTLVVAVPDALLTVLGVWWAMRRVRARSSTTPAATICDFVAPGLRGRYISRARTHEGPRPMRLTLALLATLTLTACGVPFVPLI